MSSDEEINRLAAHLFRENSGKMVAVLSRIFGFSQIERITDIIQDTFETALVKWRFSGIPENPSGWLMQVAKNKASTAFKRENRTEVFSTTEYTKNFESNFEHQLEILLSPEEITDSQLRLLFLCCHPEFSAKNQIILTLNVLCGFGVPEIANALLMKDEAVKKALTRCKQSLKNADDILQTKMIEPSDERFQTVHTILYLMFNEGYKTTRGRDTINKDLCFESVRLAQLLQSSQSNQNNECCALLSLMYFNLARFPARVSPEGELLTLEEQDRSQWNYVFIEEGYHYLKKATKSNFVTCYHLEAIIASLHCSAPTFDDTNWREIAWLYSQLEIIEPTSPIIKLNRIIAESYLFHSKKFFHELDELRMSKILKDSFLVPATQGHIYMRQCEMTEAKKAYEQALKMAVSPKDKAFLKKKISQCEFNSYQGKSNNHLSKLKN